MQKLNVVLRTCDRVSLSSNRIFPKTEIILRCLRSLVSSLRSLDRPWSLHIIDDFSSQPTQDKIQEIAPEASWNLLPPRDTNTLTPLQNSRHSVQVALDYIQTLPDDELVYLVEDDYLHYPNAVSNMLVSKDWFASLGDPSIKIGIWPQDFNQMYYHPNNPFNYVYVKPCLVVPGPDRYWRTTWYTQESFMVDVSLVKDRFEEFSTLLKIGFEGGAWEGNTISSIWQSEDVKMMMPMGTLVLHLGAPRDISFYTPDWQQLWDKYK